MSDERPTLADWDAIEPEGETTEEMLKVNERYWRDLEEAEVRSWRTWDEHRDRFGSNGDVVIPLARRR